MQIIRTIVWVLILAVLLIFSWFNWTPVEVRIWENLLVETKVPALVIVSFLLGLLPMWLYHRGAKWSLNRKIVSLENAARATIAPVAKADPAPSPAPPPAAAPHPSAAPPQPESDHLKPESNTP
ncbi:LapA family protein [Parerythrobacter aestuarii]|uniref:hypothetical protein n=1 Tax=Parerythrobacter aestuarii TaxID=3020909 RepID=UPI0024DEEAE2|nr:hypothetical protein [Parerythrobacter aestuarii]